MGIVIGPVAFFLKENECLRKVQDRSWEAEIFHLTAGVLGKSVLKGSVHLCPRTTVAIGTNSHENIGTRACQRIERRIVRRTDSPLQVGLPRPRAARPC